MAARGAIKNPFALTLAGVLFCVSLAQAAVPVENRQSSGGSTQASSPPRVADLFYQMQQLQQEIMELRGEIEEQSYRIRRLEKQRLDDYQSIDKRLQQRSKTEAARPPTSRTSSATTKKSATVKKSTPAAAATAMAGATATVSKPATSQPKTSSSKRSAKSKSFVERDAYQQAFQQLKKQELKQAQAAFENFLRDYPSGQYSANAYYWLGELYLTDENLSSARKTFATLIEDYPEYRKTPDSSFKLAKIYHQMGDDKKAEAMLKKIVMDYGQTSPPTVTLANAYLDKHFR
jgi:tol-pal system protein YbgF